MHRLRSAALVLPFVIFWSTLDRSLILPLVPPIARDMQASLALAASAITVQSLAYAALQLVWGPLSTRGRIRVLTISTALAALANLASALAPSIEVFLVARAASGGAFAATFAAVLTYVGDTVPLSRRPAAMSNLATATALGLAAGTLVSGAVASVVSWRWIFGAFALVTALLVPLLGALAESASARDDPIAAQALRLLRNRWALATCALVAIEGFVLVGIFNLLPVALQQQGTGIFVSGVVTATFGVAVVLVSQAMKLVTSRLHPAVFLAVGGLCTATAMAALWAAVTPASVVVGAGLMGVGWALGHTTLQTWMTDAAADSRALGMTLFSISLMLGGSFGAAVGSVAADHAAFGGLFASGLAAAVVLGIAASWLRLRYRVREPGPAPVSPAGSPD